MLVTCSFGTTNTGKSVYYRILEADKSTYLSRRSGGVTELVDGSGVYGVDVPDSYLIGRTVVWDIDGTSKSASETFIAAEIDVGGIDWSALWSTMPTGINLHVISPVYSGSTITVISGDDYLASENRELQWVDAGNIWPNIVGATFELTIYNQAKLVATLPVTHDESNDKLWAEMSTDVSSILPIGKSPFDIQATLPNGSKVTLVIGVFKVINDYSS